MNAVLLRISTVVALLATMLVGLAAPTALADDGTLPPARPTWSIVADGTIVEFSTSPAPGAPSVPLVYEYLDGSTVDYPLVTPTFFGSR